VGVVVEGGRHPAVVETPRDDDEGNPGVEHLGAMKWRTSCRRNGAARQPAVVAGRLW
jgi:hypothetical protein